MSRPARAVRPQRLPRPGARRIAPAMRGMSGRLAVPGALAVFVAATGLASAARAAEEDATESAERTGPPSFTRDVLPILRANCLACHNRSEAENELVLETPEDILEGSEWGAVVKPGEGAESLLVQVALHDERPHMPPPKNQRGARRLTGDEVSVIRRWIDAGAEADEGPAGGRAEWRPLPPGPHPVIATAVAADGGLAACGRGRAIALYDLDESAALARLGDPALAGESAEDAPPPAHLDRVQALAFAPGGRLLASGGFRTVKLWRRDVPAAAERVELPGDGPPRALAVDAAGRGLRVVTADGRPARIALPSIVPGDGDASAAPDGAGDPEEASGDGEAKDGGELVALAVLPGGDAVTLGAGGRLHVRGEDVTPEAGIAVDRPRALAASPGDPVRLLIAGVGGDERESGRAVVLELPPDGGAARVLSEHALPGELPAAALVPGSGSIAVGGPGGTWVLEPGATGDEARRALRGLPGAAGRLARAAREVEVFEARAGGAKGRAEQAAKELAERREAAAKARKAAEAAREAARQAEEAEEAAAEAEDEKKLEAAKKEREAKRDALKQAERALEDADRASQRAEQREARRQEELETETSFLEAARERHEDAGAAAERPLAATALAVAPGGGSLLSGDAQGRVVVWDLEGAVPREALRRHGAAVRALGFLPDGRRVSVDADGEVAVHDPRSSWSLDRRLGAPGDPAYFADRVLALDFGPRGRRLAAAGGVPSRSGGLRVVDVATGETVFEDRSTHSDTILAVDVSADGRFVATASADRFARVFSIDEGRPVAAYEGHSEHVLAVAWSADGRTLATGGADRVVKIWDVETREVRRTIEGFGKQVTAVSFLGAGNHLLAASGDSSLRVLRAGNGQRVRNLGGVPAWVHNAAVSADGRVAVAGSHEGGFRAWTCADGKALASFLPEEAGQGP